MSTEDLTGADASAADTTAIVDSQVSTEGAGAPDLDTALDSVWERHNKARDDGGRFASKSPAAAEGTDEQISNVAKDGTASPAQTGEAPKAPVSWPQEKADLWATLTPDVRDFILGREGEIEKGLATSAERLKPYEEMDRALAPWQDKFKAQGTTPAKQVERLLAAQAVFDRDPIQGLNWLAQSYGINLSGLTAPSKDGQEQQQQIDPTMRAMLQDVGQIKEVLAQRAKDDQASFEQAVQSEIADFAKLPEHAHFEAVKSVMGSLLNAGTAKDLKDAYSQAVWIVPEVRAKVLEAENKAKADKIAAEAAQAKNVQTLRVRSGPSAANPPKNVDDALKAIADKHYG